MAKMTFSLDEQSVRALRLLAERKQMPQSAIVREAIVEYAAKEEKLPDAERARKLHVIRQLRSQAPTREESAVDQELGDLRRARKTGWSRQSD